MLMLLIAATLIGPSLNASLNPNIRGTTYMLGVRYGGVRVLEGESEHIHSDDGQVPEHYTEDQQMTRHSTGKKIHLKALTVVYKRKCSNSNSDECVKLVRKLVKKAHVQHKRNNVKKMRDFLQSALDFRLCLNGFDIVHFDTDTQICCNGVFNKTSGTEECCLGGIIDSTKQFCCNGIIHNRTESYECCGTYKFDTRINICCSGSLYPKLPGATCCGNDVFNKTSQMCCFESYKFNLTEGNACCGTSVYNKDTDTCCQNSVQPIYGRKNRKGACCKDKSYHAECFRCENNAQLVAVFNESSEVCCEGMIKRKKYGNRTECCWKQVMDTKIQQCYDKDIVAKLLSTQTATYYPKGTTILLTRVDGAASGIEQPIVIIMCISGLTVVLGGCACAVLCIVNLKHRRAKPASVNNPNNYNSIGHDISGVTLSMDNSHTHYVILSNDQTLSRDCRPNNVILSSDQTLSRDCQPNNSILSSDQTLSRDCQPNNSILSSDQTLSRDCQPNNSILSSDQTLSRDCQPNNDILSNDQTEIISVLDDFNKSELLAENIQFDWFSFAQFMHNRNIKEPDIFKARLVNDENVLASHFRESCTQTCPEKACNRRTILGKPFEHNYILGISNATVQMPNSEVKMTLPHIVLRHSEVEVNCTSFRIISQLRKKLGLGDAEAIASPVVEYAVTGKGLLSDYAVVVIPFIGPTTDLEVRKFQSDEGLNTVVNSTMVPLKEKTTVDLDAFYIIKDSDVYIYTKSFSGFYCTTCRHRPLRLRCFLFGSYKRFTNPLRHEVRVMIYLADELMKYSDYKERMLTNENAEGRVLKKEIQLRLPSELSEMDEIQACVTPTESHRGQWIHKLYPGELTPIYSEQQAVTLEYVAEKCKECPHCHLPEHDIPHGMEWYLTNVDGIMPSYTFQCIVDVDIVRHVDGTKNGNRIVIDELQLRQEDRLPVEEEFDARCIRGIKEYLAGSISNEKRNAVLSALMSKYSCCGSSVEEVFFHLLEKLTPKGVLEAVVTALKSYQMFEDLDTLQKYGLVSHGLVFSAVPPVNDATTEESELHEEPMMELHEESTTELHGESMTELHRESTTELHGESMRSFSCNACSEELEELPCAMVNLNNMRKPARVQESTESVHTNNAVVVRSELNRTLQSTSFSKSADDIPNLGGHDARGELPTRSLGFIPNNESRLLHVQENASLDDMILKTVK